MNSINSLIWNPNNYQQLQSSSKVSKLLYQRYQRYGATMNILPHGAKPSVHKTYACKQSHLHPGYHPFIMRITLFFLFKADKMHQVFPSYLDTRIKPLPNFWFLSSDVRVSEPAPESCSPYPSWGKVVFISGTRLGFLKTKPSSMNK